MNDLTCLPAYVHAHKHLLATCTLDLGGDPVESGYQPDSTSASSPVCGDSKLIDDVPSDAGLTVPPVDEASLQGSLHKSSVVTVRIADSPRFLQHSNGYLMSLTGLLTPELACARVSGYTDIPGEDSLRAIACQTKRRLANKVLILRTSTKCSAG